MRALDTESGAAVRVGRAASPTICADTWTTSRSGRGRRRSATARRTFVRRHRGSTAAVCGGVRGIAGRGWACPCYEARLADARLEQVRSLASKLVFDVHDAVRDLPGSTKARQMIVQTGLHYLDELAKSAGRDPRAREGARRRLPATWRRPGQCRVCEPWGPSGRARSVSEGAAASGRCDPQRIPDIDARTEQLVVLNRIATIQAETGKAS